MAKNLNRLKALSLIFTFSLMISFLTETNTLCNYVADSGAYSSNKNANFVIKRLRHDVAIISEWFYENYMLLNADKSYFLTLGFHGLFPDFFSMILQLKMLPRKKFLVQQLIIS